MGYIAPNSTIILYDNVPLDNSYRNTLYFANETTQQSYFQANANAHQVAILNSQMYQRVKYDVCRVEANYSTIYSVNYMAFKNTSFENKWFYAFVNKVVYVNDRVAELHYEIDAMQTYLFDVELKPCLVEREHIPAADDVVGANVLPEAIPIGEYRMNGVQKLIELSANNLHYYIIVGVVDDKNTDMGGILSGKTVNTDGVFKAVMPLSDGKMLDGVYTGLKYYAFEGNNQGASDLTSFINTHIKTVDNIYMIYMAPALIVPQPGSDHSIAPGAGSIPVRNINCPSVASVENLDFDGYYPINRKLYTYPYNYCGLTNGSGESLVTRYEWFPNFTPSFDATATFVHPVTLTFRPGNGYKGIENPSPDVDINDMCESITLTGFPLCSWSYDTYARWAATRVPQIIRSGIVSVVEGASRAGTMVASAGLAAGALGTADAAVGGMENIAKLNFGTNLLSKAANIYEEKYTASIAQDPIKGSTANGNADFASGKFGIWRYRGHIHGDTCKMIDHYFSMFGYKTNLIKIPNRTGRPIWNYVKTVNCVVEKKLAGVVQSSDITQIEGIYDSGITWWHDPTQVNNYSEANMAANHA